MFFFQIASGHERYDPIEALDYGEYEELPEPVETQELIGNRPFHKTYFTPFFQQQKKSFNVRVRPWVKDMWKSMF